jgi:poly-beta-1,6-N-acetyl-D-glucosamine synthase
VEFWNIAIFVLLVVGVSTFFWAAVGLVRWTGEQYRRRFRPLDSAASPSAPDPEDVAILIAAHNEALVIRETIASAALLVPLENIHIISDMSSDATAQIAREAGVNVLELHPNRGKAGALAEGIQHFDLCRRFEVVLLLDADTRPRPDYLSTGLPMFQDPQVVAVAGRAKSVILPHSPRALGRFLVAYRDRLYLVVQLLLKYGQAAKHANVVTIVPGFASMYRTSALKHIDVVGQGLVIEDFNMTFEVHAKKLGRIAFHPSEAVAYTQDPDNLHDYIRQVRRWTLGFWQTVRRHHPRFDKFWANLSVHILELVSSGVFLVLLLPVFAVSLVSDYIAQQEGGMDTFVGWMAGVLPPEAVLIGVLVPDYLLSIFAAIALRRPGYLLFGLLFPLMRILDAAICLSQIPKAWLSTSTGVWKSPRRRVQSGGVPEVVGQSYREAARV